MINKKIRFYDEKCDVWSIGICLYIMITQIFPFDERTNSKLYKLILDGFYVDEDILLLDCKPELKELLALLLENDYVNRKGCSDILQFINNKITSKLLL